MTKRFKSKPKSKMKLLKIGFVFLIIYISFSVVYNLIYNLYLSKLSNEEIIGHLIKNAENNKVKNNFFKKYQDPQVILGEVFTFKEGNNDIPANKIVDVTPKVYIYSTHETESYEDKYLEVYNIKPNVKMMGYILKEYLEDLGISTLVSDGGVTDILKAHNWSYKYSYEASKELIMPVLNSNPNLKLVIDLHRDSAPLSKTLLTKDDINYAKVLFVVGGEHENYEVNYKLAETLKNYLENEVSGITRGISLKKGPGVNGIYNQDLNKNSVLIELGGQYNEIEEINNTLKILSKVILKYLEE